MKISFADVDLERTGALVVLVQKDRVLGAHGSALDAKTGGVLTRALAASRMSGKPGECLDLPGIGAGRIVLAGVGEGADLTPQRCETVGAAIAAALAATPETSAAVIVEDGLGVEPALAAAHLLHGARLRSYRFDTYRTKLKDEERPALKTLVGLTANASQAKKLYGGLDKLGDAVVYARDLVSEPANTLYPESYAARLQKDLPDLGIEVEVLGVKDMKKLGMGALLGVGQGAEHEPRLVVMTYSGGKGGAAPLALVGKGVCFDSGGLSLKPAKSMEDMKWDMAGSAAVVGAMMAIAGRKAKVNAVAVLALVENMPSGNAQRPGDVVTSMSGQTIEVLNTDAEGRLILADAVWYCEQRFKPAAMIDLATLTGAIMIALGSEHVGLFANNDTLADSILAAGKATGETVWRMPLGDEYDKMINSDIADMKNIADGSAGSIIGAVFIQRFVKDVPWAHLDIAGVAWGKKDKGITPKGATGWGVRLLDRLSRDHFEPQ
ncbi:MAG: leucyl aminopeptidase [Alphaproteobacteria bacterium]|nr:leucyl aminopeptidase [Alphaproteobacteria bacterium]TAD88435.1 MAG: leucyl aminopeptidase [Alphaproteobacteria bacterium]